MYGFQHFYIKEYGFCINNMDTSTSTQSKFLDGSNYTKEINKDLEKLDDNYWLQVCDEILTPFGIRSLLLEYELTHYTCKPKEYDLQEFAQEADLLLNRYQKYIINDLEDIQWTLHDKTSKRYKVGENEILFENSVPQVDFTGLETETYLNRIKNRLNMMVSNIKVDLQNTKEDNIVFIQLWLIKE